MDIEDELRAMQKMYQQKKLSLEKRLRKAPDGEICCCTDHSRYRKYRLLLPDQPPRTIPRDQTKLITSLIAKKADEAELDDVTRNLRACSLFLAHYRNHDRQKLPELLGRDAYHDLLKARSYQNDEDRAWAETDYPRNPKKPENLKYRTDKGDFVRSKSEGDIAAALYALKIPYRYEQGLSLNGNTIYPDFTIKHPSNGETIIWEHFGLLDHEDYAEAFSRKLRMYVANNYVPGNNLIMTFETPQHPLTTGIVRKNIQDYLGV